MNSNLVLKFEFPVTGPLTFLLTANKSTESRAHVHRFFYGKEYTEYTIRDNKNSNSKRPVPLLQVAVSRLGYIYVASPEKVQK